MSGPEPRSQSPDDEPPEREPQEREPPEPEPQDHEPPDRDRPERVTLVLGTTAGGTGTHVRMLADGLAGRGVAVTVAGPSAADARLAFSAVPGASFAAVEIGERPRPGDLTSILRLRGLLAANADVVHAHGLRAGALSLIALTLVRGGRRPRTVVTAHNAPPSGGGAPVLVYRLLERLVARRADLVLCVSPDLEARMRAAGARRVERAVIAAPDDPAAQPGGPLGVPTGRPVVLGAGRLAPQKGFGVLLEAAAAWRDLDPAPLVVIAGDGPLGGELMAKAAELGVDAVFVGHRADVPALLAIAAVFVLPSQWEGQPLVLQEALRAGTPVVATRVGGIPDLAGGEALLVPPEDAPALAAAVRSVLTDPLLGAALRVAAASRASLLPTPAAAVDAALTAYAPPLTSTCLCLLLRTRGDGVREVLLGDKKTGFGRGKVVAPGGHIEPGESAAAAAAREVKEESGIRVSQDALTEAAQLTFLFPAHPSWDMDVTIFTSADWSGEAAESDEIRPQWFPVTALPLDRMWDDGKHWLPRVLAGERLRAVFRYAPDNETVATATITPLP